MAAIKPSVPKGTRDFSPAEMVKRNYIFDTIKSVFRKYGYQQIETPTMENSDTLLGKYGDEGDKLIFKILESGDYFATLKNQRYFDKISIWGIRKDVSKDLRIIFNDYIAQGFNNFHEIKNKTNTELKFFFNSYLKSDFKNLNEISEYQIFRKAFIDHFFSKGIDRKFKDHQTRFHYYFQIQDREKRKQELKKAETYLLDRNKYVQLIKENAVSLRQASMASSVAPNISKKALRYDLTVPFARYVVMHQNEITMPFKRFQVQPVWRADRPQKGRYREFYQCDADVVGSNSLLNEAEFIMIYDEALSNLGLKDFTIKINNRKILSGIAEIIGKPELIIDMTVAIDKLDKIGLDGVVNELLTKGFVQEDIDKLEPIILLEGTNYEKLHKLRAVLASSEIGLKGCHELEEIFEYINNCKLHRATLELDITLARGLNYYTGAIFEVKTNEAAMGSIGGGGRYDDLTGMFGLKGLTGAGISFGADRIYDVLEELNLFPEGSNQTTKMLICTFDKGGEIYSLPLLQQLRAENINAELYPSGTKINKQFDYANKKNIPYVIVIGSDEIESGHLTFKNMSSGEQEKLTVNQILVKVK